MVRNALGSDALGVALSVRTPPTAPAPRLRATAVHALQVSWEKPHDGGAHILGKPLVHSHVHNVPSTRSLKL